MRVPKEVKQVLTKQVSTFGVAALLMYTLGCSETRKQSSAETQNSATQSEQAEQRNNQVVVGQVVEGELTKVDAVAKTLSIKISQGREMELRYNDQTQISGAEGSVEGLAIQSRTPVRARFDAASKTATKIEVGRRRQQN
jgi:hypothetical protein